MAPEPPIDPSVDPSTSLSGIACDSDEEITGEVVERPEVDDLCILLADEVAAKGIKRPDPTRKGWRDAARLMIDKEELDPKSIEQIIRWVHSPGQWWAKNILSMPTLREKWDRLWLEAKEQREKSQNGRGGVDQRIADLEVARQAQLRKEQTERQERATQ